MLRIQVWGLGFSDDFGGLGLRFWDLPSPESLEAVFVLPFLWPSRSIEADPIPDTVIYFRTKKAQ